jgi:hypothetical protein
MNNYYIYFHINKTTGDVFYVGKGKDTRAWKKDNRNNHWNNIVNKYGYEVHIIHENLSEQRAFDWEKLYISMFGRNNLCNLTDGGEGSSGYKHNIFSLDKMRGYPKSEKAKYKMSIARIGKEPWNKNTNYSGMSGKKHSEETLQKMSLGKKGANNPLAKEIIWNGKKYSTIKELHSEIAPNSNYENFCRKIKKTYGQNVNL